MSLFQVKLSMKIQSLAQVPQQCELPSFLLLQTMSCLLLPPPRQTMELPPIAPTNPPLPPLPPSVPLPGSGPSYPPAQVPGHLDGIPTPAAFISFLRHLGENKNSLQEFVKEIEKKTKDFLRGEEIASAVGNVYCNLNAGKSCRQAATGPLDAALRFHFNLERYLVYEYKKGEKLPQDIGKILEDILQPNQNRIFLFQLAKEHFFVAHQQGDQVFLYMGWQGEYNLYQWINSSPEGEQFRHSFNLTSFKKLMKDLFGKDEEAVKIAKDKLFGKDENGLSDYYKPTAILRIVSYGWKPPGTEALPPQYYFSPYSQ